MSAPRITLAMAFATDDQPRARGWRRAAAIALTILFAAGVVTMALRLLPIPREATATAAEVLYVSETSETMLRALPVVPPQEERWRDLADVAYRDACREAFSYADTDAHRAEVCYGSPAPTLQGVLVATGLKPNLAYQLKLTGLTPLRGPSERANAEDVRAWSSWQLGRLGRWWCEDCAWNVPDADLAAHVGDGHRVRGYLLFDWFVTDGAGDARHEFALDSSLHVLWRVGQRERAPEDTPPRWYRLERDSAVYPPHAAGVPQDVGLFAEWEPGRPPLGRVRLPAGEYEVGLNLTEETFHANLGEARALEGGGFWPWVLEAELRFEVRRAISRASCSGCLPGPHEEQGRLGGRQPSPSAGV